MEQETRNIFKVAITGIIISTCLIIATVLTIGDGRYAPEITILSAIFSISFFVLNPIHFLIFIATGIIMPEWLFYSASVVVMISWWFFVGKTVNYFIQRRKNA